MLNVTQFLRRVQGVRLLHEDVRSGYPHIQVFENHERRWLRFDDRAIQSAMSLERPERLLLAYTQVMMTALLFEPNPRSALVLGLGGGSMVRFLRHHFPGCETTVVEISEAVADVARRYFLVPPDGDGFRLVLADAARYVEQCDRRFDLILVDVFESDRTIDVFASSEFFDACRRLLSPAGVASVNVLADGELEALGLSKRFRRSFEERSLALRVPERTNLVLVGMARSPREVDLRELRRRAAQMGPGLDLDLEACLDDLLAINARDPAVRAWRAGG